MKFYLITTMVCLLFCLGYAITAFFRPMKKNILFFIALPISFALTYILQVLGLLGFLGNIFISILTRFEVISNVLEESQYAENLIKGTACALSSAVVFPIVFAIIHLILNIIIRGFNYFPGIMNIGYYADKKPETAIAGAADNADAKKETLTGAKANETNPEQTLISQENGTSGTIEASGKTEIEENNKNRKKSDKTSENNITESLGLRFGSAAIGLVRGFLLAAIALMPVFYAASYFDEAVKCERDVVIVDKVNVREGIIDIDENYYKPYENSFTTKLYKATGISTLLCNVIDKAGLMTVDGTSYNIPYHLRNLINNGTKIYIQTNALHESDAPMAPCFSELSKDDFITGMIADIVSYESNCLKEGKSGIILNGTSYEQTNSFGKYFLGVIADAYKDSDKSDIKDDIRVILEASASLSEKEFFNDFLTDFNSGEEANSSFANTLLKNIRFIGKGMDSLYSVDDEHSISDKLFEIILNDESINGYITMDDINILNKNVVAGKTTYSKYTITLQNLIALVEIK